MSEKREKNKKVMGKRNYAFPIILVIGALVMWAFQYEYWNFFLVAAAISFVVLLVRKPKTTPKGKAKVVATSATANIIKTNNSLMMSPELRTKLGDKVITSAMLLETGGLAVFDQNEKQVPELQWTYSIEKHKKILLRSDEKTKFMGFHILPIGFRKSAEDYAAYFKSKNMTADEIENLPE